MGSRLTSEAWAEVERLYRGGESAKVLARRYGVQANTIHHRASKERWRSTRVRAAALSPIERLEAVANRLEVAARTLTGSQK
ncbi:hypothetical protein [Paraburkholderia sp. J63]|uniref:hypothetical protein n=1 Tax=Paraburkholderia sp. J63 TaxID=2805434 RepID=UPI002ABD291D|nr:hypothetical protein [Paraburkholderia sp. J63]